MTHLIITEKDHNFTANVVGGQIQVSGLGWNETIVTKWENKTCEMYHFGIGKPSLISHRSDWKATETYTCEVTESETLKKYTT